MKEVLYYPMSYLPALVIEGPTGITFKFSIGGTADWERSVEGIVYPIAASGNVSADTTLGDRLHDVAYDLVGIMEPTAKEIDTLLAGDRQIPSLELIVDRDKMDDSCDQWIHVILLSVREGHLRGFDLPLRCILTW